MSSPLLTDDEIKRLAEDSEFTYADAISGKLMPSFRDGADQTEEVLRFARSIEALVLERVGVRQ